MSGNTNQHSSYTASDIEKYLKGELSAPEMHRLEKAALDDPFLADAMEGMEMHHSAMHKDLDELRERLQKRVSGKDEEQKAGKPMWKMAAVFILLIGLGGITYFTFFKGKSMYSLAVSEKKIQDTTSVQSKGPSNGPSESASPSPSQAAAGGLTKSDAQKDSDSITAQTVPSPKKVKPSSTKYSFKAPRSSNNDLKSEAATNSFNLSTTPAPGLNITRDFEKSTDTHPPLLVSGKVVDQNNKPLSGVSLSLDGKDKFTAVTDNNGQFNLRLPKQDSSARLRASSVGYQDFAMSLNTDNRIGNVIQLKPENASLNEVVVVGYGSKKRKKSAEEETFTKKDTVKLRTMESLNPKTEPVVGWASYKTYLERNKNTGKADSTVKGEVVLSFRVDKNGVLSSFRIEKSLSPSHDSTLLHLVQQGPSWKLLKGKKAKAMVTLSF
ncbi:carboxypeptidase-like regulatory domain-containing protein [Flavitalea flava]